MTRGGKRVPGEGKKLGRSVGSTKDRVKLGISISRENAEWLRSQKAKGKNISALLDEAIEWLRARENA